MKVSKNVKPLNTDDPTMGEDYLSVASSTDCTGLAPTLALNSVEAANYDEIVPYLPPIAPTPELNGLGEALLKAEGIHAEVNTLDKDPFSKKGMEGNHLLSDTQQLK